MMLDFDSHGVGWVPAALIVALVVATPVPWCRRASAPSWGLLAIHVFVVLSIQIYIRNQSDATNGLKLIELSPFWKTVVSGVEATLVAQLGASFVAPILVWIFVTFRRGDLRSFRVENRPETLST